MTQHMLLAFQVRDGKVDSEQADIDAALNMAPTDQETEVVPPAEEPEEMPLPSDANVTFLGGLFVLALLAIANVASEIVLQFIAAARACTASRSSPQRGLVLIDLGHRLERLGFAAQGPWPLLRFFAFAYAVLKRVQRK